MNNNLFNVKVVTPLKTYPLIETSKLVVQTDSGIVTILSKHEEYLANINISVIEITINEVVKHFACGGGAIHFNSNENTAILLVNSFISVNDIDIEKVKQQQQEAERKLKAATSNFEHKNAEISLKRALNELYTKDKYKE